VTLKSTSLENILSTVDTISGHVISGKIKNPQLQSFQFGKNGEFEVSVSFFAVFDSI
jgi:hypothetical protein